MKKLPVHEWLIVVLLLILMALFATIGFSSGHPEMEKPHYLISHLIEVQIEGAVAYPGSYEMKRGSVSARSVR